MENFELLRNITIGQYLPTGSIIHRLDPRTKIVAGLCLLLAVSLSSRVVPVAVLLLAIIGIALAARVPLSYLLRGLLLGLPVLALVFVLQLIFQGNTEPAQRVYFQWGWLRITRFSLQLITV